MSFVIDDKSEIFYTTNRCIKWLVLIYFSEIFIIADIINVLHEE